MIDAKKMPREHILSSHMRRLESDCQTDMHINFVACFWKKNAEFCVREVSFFSE